jgi:hypothetical protein
MNIVISVYHCKSERDYTFIHGIFPCPKEAKAVAEQVRLNPAYILEEGYEYDDQQDRGISVEVIYIPVGIRVNEYVQTDY